MHRTTFKVSFFIKRKKTLKNGNAPIYARITVNKERSEFGIHRDIDPESWDPGFGRVKGNSNIAKQINKQLEVITKNIYDHRINLEETGKEITAKSVRNSYLGLVEKQRTILEVFKEHNDRCEKLINIDFAHGTVERYKTCYSHTESFIKFMYNKEDLRLNDITPTVINDYEYYLKTEKSCGHNTAVKYLRNFKKITRIALNNGWMRKDPFRGKKYHLKEVDMDFLSEAELTKLIEKKFKINRLQQVKDIYLFCCFTGLAFVDVKNLTYDELVEEDGKLWIKKKRQKTKNWCNVPLLEPAVGLVNKYKDHPVCNAKGVVFPVPTNQKMNSYLKEIADLTEIEKNLSTHTARHTFATTVTLQNQVSIEVVSKMLGHSSIIMTNKYARVVDDLITKDMNKIQGKYGEVV